jgi:hypothetical protein
MTVAGQADAPGHTRRGRLAKLASKNTLPLPAAAVTPASAAAIAY